MSPPTMNICPKHARLKQRHGYNNAKMHTAAIILLFVFISTIHPFFGRVVLHLDLVIRVAAQIN